MSGLPNDIATGGAAGPDSAQRSSGARIGAAHDTVFRPDRASCIDRTQSSHSSKSVLAFARPSQTAAGLLRGPFKGFVTGHCQPTAIADRSRFATANSGMILNADTPGWRSLSMGEAHYV